MKSFKLSYFLMILLSVFACKKEDDEMMPSCTPADWVGTYVGTVDCDGTTENTTVTITASGSDEIVIKYETSTVTTTFDPIAPNGCDLSRNASNSGVTATVDATLDGNTLNLSETLSGGGFDSDCMLTATRQ